MTDGQTTGDIYDWYAKKMGWTGTQIWTVGGGLIRDASGQVTGYGPSTTQTGTPRERAQYEIDSAYGTDPESRLALVDRYEKDTTTGTSLADFADIATILNTVSNALIGDYERQVTAGELTGTQALNQYAQDLSAAIEGGRRGQDVAAIMEARAKKTTQSQYFPGLEPGGFMAGISQKWGAPAPPTLSGVPVESLPDPWESYRQGYQSVTGQIGTAPTAPQGPEPVQTAPMFGGLQQVLDQLMGANNQFKGTLGQGGVSPSYAPQLTDQQQQLIQRIRAGISTP